MNVKFGFQFTMYDVRDVIFGHVKLSQMNLRDRDINRWRIHAEKLKSGNIIKQIICGIYSNNIIHLRNFILIKLSQLSKNQYSINKKIFLLFVIIHLYQLLEKKEFFKTRNTEEVSNNSNQQVTEDLTLRISRSDFIKTRNNLKIIFLFSIVFLIFSIKYIHLAKDFIQ